MSQRTKLEPYEQTFLKRFRENFSRYVTEASKEEGTKDIKEVFLNAISKLFDLEMAFIAEKKKGKLIVLHAYTEEEDVKNRLKEATFEMDEKLKRDIKEGLSLTQDDLKDYEQFNGFDSMQPISIKTEGPKCQYLFLCNRKETTIHGSLYTTYDSSLCKILCTYLFPCFELPPEDILQSVIKIVEDSYHRLPKEVIFDERKFKESEIDNTLSRAENDIEMWYMPIVSLQNHSNIFGYEMLARDVKETDPKKYPGEIFEKAKALGISSKLDYICVKKAFDKIEKVFTHPEENPSLQGKFFFINIHQETVYDERFKELFKKKSSLRLPWFVVFEIIDTESIKDYDEFRKEIKELFLYGYHFADDDHKNEWKDDKRFELKPRYIRIGEKFMRKLVADEGKEIIDKLVRGAFSFGGYVIPEYITTGELSEGLIKTLQGSGMFLGQGHMFGEARRTPILPSKELLTLEKALEDWVKAERKIDEFRREMTFLIIDVAGSTEVKKGKEEKDVIYTFNKYHDYVEHIVGKNNVEKTVWSGDGGLCVFQASDKAVNSAIQIQEGLDGFNQDKAKNRLDRPIMVRIGINTGILLVDPSQEPGKWASEVMDIAGHLQKYSEPGGIRIGEETYKKLTDKTNFKEDKSIDGVKTYLYQKR